MNIPGDDHCTANFFAAHFKEKFECGCGNKLDVEFCINLQKYRQFSECSTNKIIEEVYNYITMKRYNNAQQTFSYMRLRLSIRLK